MKYLLIILVTFVSPLISFTQSSFETLIQNEEDQVPSGLIEDNTGNIICSFYDFDNNNANLIKLNTEGVIIDSKKIINPNGLCEISLLIKIENDSFLGLGIYSEDTNNYLWFNKFDEEFNHIMDIKIPVSKKVWSYYMHSSFNQIGNVVLTTVYEKGFYNSEICIFELTLDGVLIREKYFDSQSNQMVLCFDILQPPNCYYFKIFTMNFYQKAPGQILTLDTNFSILDLKPIPWYNSDLNTAKSIDNNRYLLSGKKILPDIPDDHNLGLILLDSNDLLIDSMYFGKIDSVDSPGAYDNLDFINTSNIYYGGFSNIDKYNPFYSSMPSWFILNKLDENLDLIWQKFYGGDACYNLWSILATQDGGCVMAGTRYDYQTQNQERDVYILKVNEDGILTWTYNFPETTKQVIVYPNPGRDEIRINTFEGNLTFDLFDIKGNKILSQPIENEDKINTSHLEKGVYTFRILNQKSETIETGKWIKE